MFLKKIFVCSTLLMFLFVVFGCSVTDGIENSGKVSSVSSSSSIGLNGAALQFFIENKGQGLSDYKYYFKGGDQYIYFADDRVIYRNLISLEDGKVRDTAYEMMFSNVNNSVKLYGKEENETKINYFLGGDERKEYTELRTFKQIVYEDLYDGIDLVFKFQNGRMKYEFVVDPYADYSKISMCFNEVSDLKVGGEGNLLISTPVGIVQHGVPFIYQDSDSGRSVVDGGYVLDSKTLEVSFKVGRYDVSKILVIDPFLVNLDYSRFLGGAGTDVVTDMRVDGSGNVYVYGTTSSSDFPATVGAYDVTYYGSGTDAFVVKYNAGLTTLSAATFIGAGSVILAEGMYLDGSANVYITGMTGSGYPTTTGAYDETANGGYDIFVSELNSSLTSLTASTYIGGGDNDWGYDIFVTATAVYILGLAHAGYPTTTGAYDETNNGQDDIVISKFTTNLTTLSASTFFGTTNDDSDGPEAIYVDGSGNVYIAGTGRSVAGGLPTTPGAYDTTFGAIDGFISEFSSDLTTLSASTYLGTTDSEILDIFVDGSSNVWVVGGTTDTSFPTTAGVYDQTHNNGYDVFVSEMNSTLTSLTASTFIGGGSTDLATALTIDSSGNVYITGSANSSETNYPVTSGVYDTSQNGGGDVIISKLNSTLTSLTASTFIGGDGNESGNAIVLNGAEQYVVVAGYAQSGFPVSTGSYGGGFYDGFVARFDNFPNTIPAATQPGTISQATDGTGYVTFHTIISDDDSDDTKLKIEYSDDGGVSFYDPDLVSADPSSGSVDVNDDNAYQIGTSDVIDTSGGAISLTIVWDTMSVSNGNGSLDGADQSDIQVRVTPNDGTDDGTAQASASFEVDNLDPSGLGSFAVGTPTTTTMPLTWAAATETNFDHYEIWYGTVQGDVQSRSGTAVEWDNVDDAVLAVITTAATTITGLNPDTQYYFKIWAVDDYGNVMTVSDINAYTLANVPGTPIVTANSITALNVIINQNFNPSNTTYAIKVGSQYVGESGGLGETETWRTYTAWGGAGGVNTTGLSGNTQYTVSVKAKNGNSTETAFSGEVSKYTLAGYVTGATLTNATDKSSYSISLSWTNVGQNGVKIDLSSVSGGACDATYDVGNYDNVSANPSSPRSISVSGNTCYKARIGSYNGDGVLNTTDYVYSNELTTPPVQSTGLRSTAADADSITWGWDSVTGATNYKIYRNSDDVYVGQTGGDATSYEQTTVTDGGEALSANMEYTVYVRAENANGEGIASSSASAYTDANVPTSPSHDEDVQAVTTMGWTWGSGGAQKDYYAYMDSPSGNSGYITDLFWTVSGSLSPNTQYTFYVKARNEVDELTGTVSASGYTSQTTPTDMSFSDVTAASITITAEGGFFNLTTGSSGIRFQNTTTTADNTLTTEVWVNSSLDPNVEYSYTVSGINGDGDETSSVSSTKYTLANVPGAPTVDGATGSTLDVTINVNSNSSITEFVIHEKNTNQFVQINGTLGEGEIWQVAGTGAGQWGNNTGVGGKVRVTGLSVATSYDFEVKARNGESIETVYGTSSSLYTLVSDVTAPTVDNPTVSSLDVVIAESSNPDTVTYKIYEETSAKHVQADGTLGDVSVWQTAAAWGGVSGINGKITVTGLSSNVSHSFIVTPKSPEEIEGVPSDASSLYTLANLPSAGAVTLRGTTVTVSWEANGNPEGTQYCVSRTEVSSRDFDCITALTMTDSVSVSGTYTYSVSAKNGDSVETSDVSIGSVTYNTGGGVIMLIHYNPPAPSVPDNSDQNDVQNDVQNNNQDSENISEEDQENRSIENVEEVAKQIVETADRVHGQVVDKVVERVASREELTREERKTLEEQKIVERVESRVEEFFGSTMRVDNESQTREFSKLQTELENRTQEFSESGAESEALDTERQENYKQILESAKEIFAGSADIDGDGVSNANELKRGTDPLLNDKGTITELFSKGGGERGVDSSIGRLKMAAVSSNGFMLSGTTKPDKKVIVKVGGNIFRVISDKNGHYIVPVELTDVIDNSVVVVETDVDGEKSSVLVKVEKDTMSAPTFEFEGRNVIQIKDVKADELIMYIDKSREIKEVWVKYVIKIFLDDSDTVKDSRSRVAAGDPDPWIPTEDLDSWFAAGDPDPWVAAGDPDPWIPTKDLNLWLAAGDPDPWVAAGDPDPWFPVDKTFRIFIAGDDNSDLGTTTNRTFVRGKAAPFSTVIIAYKSVIYSSVVIADKNGDFKTELPKDLATELNKNKDLKEIQHELISFAVDYKTNKVSPFTKGLFKMFK